ncbi:hypothetical protein VPNG_00028 [Cytospora leucostoma]|uniref:Uncharacterized protein n=1 Tax=Cytospora leucostoma TaxID=1230097 RepID=A0A423XNY0_9PEZI|nr:hypothetical protein VPNG_00028 [Cytospora leucostoma]
MARSVDAELLQMRWGRMTAHNFGGLENSSLRSLYFGAMVQAERGSRKTKPRSASVRGVPVERGEEIGDVGPGLHLLLEQRHKL